jgi:hypothetical protein
LVYRYNRAAKVRTFFHSRKTFAYIFINVKQFAAYLKLLSHPLSVLVLQDFVLVSDYARLRSKVDEGTVKVWECAVLSE